MMPEEIWPQTKISTNNLETKLSDITFAACNTSIPTLITKMLDIKHQIKAAKGVTYKPNCIMTLLFDKLSGYNNKMFCCKFIAACSAYNKGKMTQDEVFETLKLVYRTEQAAGIWANLMPSKLTTNLSKANIELHKMNSLGGVGSGGGRGGGTRRGNGKREAEKGGAGGNNAAMSHAWMLARTADIIKHPSQGYKMKWCKLCGPDHTKGTPSGMYMQASHDHEKCLLSKKEN
jgi:hypothetical protein